MNGHSGKNGLEAWYITVCSPSPSLSSEVTCVEDSDIIVEADVSGGSFYYSITLARANYPDLHLVVASRFLYLCVWFNEKKLSFKSIY